MKAGGFPFLEGKFGVGVQVMAPGDRFRDAVGADVVAAHLVHPVSAHWKAGRKRGRPAVLSYWPNLRNRSATTTEPI